MPNELLAVKKSTKSRLSKLLADFKSYDELINALLDLVQKGMMKGDIVMNLGLPLFAAYRNQNMGKPILLKR
jgi:hypothetical protein